MAIIFDGKAQAALKKISLQKQIESLEKRIKQKIGLAIVLVGDDESSKIYTRKKSEMAKELGIKAEIFAFKADITTLELISQIKKLNDDSSFQGILVQLPFPSIGDLKNNQREILDSISQDKDVDCLTSYNMGRLAFGQPLFLPATVKAIMTILEIALPGDTGNLKDKVMRKQIGVVGYSDLVGKPMSLVLENYQATVYVVNEITPTNIVKDILKRSQIIVSGAGVPGLITSEMVSDGTIVIDAGIEKVNGKVVGDVDFNAVKDKTSFITPVPGGVGPMTVVSLLGNLVEAAMLQFKT